MRQKQCGRYRRQVCGVLVHLEEASSTFPTPEKAASRELYILQIYISKKREASVDFILYLMTTERMSEVGKQHCEHTCTCARTMHVGGSEGTEEPGRCSEAEAPATMQHRVLWSVCTRGSSYKPEHCTAQQPTRLRRRSPQSSAVCRGQLEVSQQSTTQKNFLRPDQRLNPRNLGGSASPAVLPDAAVSD